MDNTLEEQDEEKRRFAEHDLADKIEFLRTEISTGYGRPEYHAELRKKEAQLAEMYNPQPEVASLIFIIRKLSAGGAVGRLMRYDVIISNPSSAPEAEQIKTISLLPKSMTPQQIEKMPVGYRSLQLRP